MPSTYLTKTFGTPTSDKIGTVSFWCKKAINDVNTNPFSANSNAGAFNFEAGNFIDVFEAGGWLRTTQLFRDLSAWYHIVRTVDTTQATASERLKLYVNGERVTSFTNETYPALNASISFGGASQNVIGANSSIANYFNGCMAHFHFIDGTAYDASAFGQTDATSGIWKPILSPSVTYGTNGFFLKFGNAGSLGTDSSGNGNNFTVNGSGTQTLDTPSNVFATLNPIRAAGDTRTFENGNTKVTAKTTDGIFHCSYSTLGVTQGKWYAEFKLAVGGNPTNNASISGASAEVSQDDANNNGNAVGQTSYNGVGSFSVDTVNESGITTYTAGDIIGVAMNVDDGEITFYKNGTIVDTTQNLTTTAGNGICYFVAITRYISTQASWEANFGNGYFGTTAVSTPESDSEGIGKFEYSVPSGYYALCTKNIATYG